MNFLVLIECFYVVFPFDNCNTVEFAVYTKINFKIYNSTTTQTGLKILDLF